MLGDAKGSVNNEPGCLRFDVIQEGADPNRIWLYEVYVDEAGPPRITRSAGARPAAPPVLDGIAPRYVVRRASVGFESAG